MTLEQLNIVLQLVGTLGVIASLIFNQPGVKMLWELRRGNFNPRFRNFLDSLPAPKVPTFVEIMHGSAVTRTSQ